MKFCIQHGRNIIDSYGNASTSTLFLITRGRRGEWGLEPRPSGHEGISGQQNVDWTNAVTVTQCTVEEKINKMANMTLNCTESNNKVDSFPFQFSKLIRTRNIH